MYYFCCTEKSKLEWADYAAVLAQCGNLSGNELTCNSTGNAWPQSSQLAEPLWTDPSLKSGISVCNLISTLKKKREKSTGGKQIVEHSLKTLHTKKKPSPPHWNYTLLHVWYHFWTNILLDWFLVSGKFAVVVHLANVISRMEHAHYWVCTVEHRCAVLVGRLWAVWLNRAHLYWFQSEWLRWIYH